MSEILNRYDFIFLFDVKDGNPNGDPDAGNLPRVDPETGHGLVTDVCLKRKVRNYVLMKHDAVPPHDIFVKEKAVLNRAIEDAHEGVDLQSAKDTDGNKRRKKGEGQGSEVNAARDKMCARFFDIRTFGAVLSTGANAGQVRGPAQLTFARSIDPIVTLEHTITRVAVTTEKESIDQGGDNRTMGRKNTVPYGLYLGHGFVSPFFAKQTGFSSEDLSLFWEALENLFEHDHSAARGLMSMRKLLVFEHGSALGSAPAHRLFDTVKIARREPERPARGFDEYELSLDSGSLPDGITLHERI